MIDIIIDDIKNIIKSDDCKAVYSAFDSIPYYCKSSEISTYVGVSSFETKRPIYTADTVFLPFYSTIRLDVTAPASYSADVLFRFFDEFILPRLNDSKYNIWEMKSLIIRPDTNLKKLVLKCEFNISGIFRKERQNVN